MKKITTNGAPFDFRVDGQTVLMITPEGCLANDEQAAFVKERLGDNVVIADVTLEQAAAEVIEVEEAPVEEVVEAAPEQETPAEETASPEEEAPVEESKPKSGKRGNKTK